MTYAIYWIDTRGRRNVTLFKTKQKKLIDAVAYVETDSRCDHIYKVELRENEE